MTCSGTDLKVRATQKQHVELQKRLKELGKKYEQESKLVSKNYPQLGYLAKYLNG